MVSISHILLLRPTHSFTVFLQQLGRSLRRHFDGLGFSAFRALTTPQAHSPRD